MRGQRWPRSDCAYAQSDQGLHSPLPESLDTKEYINGELRPGLDLAHAQDDMNPQTLRLLEAFFSLETVKSLITLTNLCLFVLLVP